MGRKINKRQRWIIYCLAAISPIITAALRYKNGADYFMYLRMFEIYNRNNATIASFHSIKSTEFGFFILIRVCGVLFGSNYYLYFGLIASIICSFYYAGFCRQSKLIVLSGLLFFITGTYFDTFNGLRQYIAAGIIFFSIQYIVDGKFWKYLIFVLFASTFHYTALLMIPVYWIRNLKIDQEKAAIIVIVLLLGGALIFNLVKLTLSFTRYKYYLSSAEFEVVPTLNTILTTTIVSSIVFVYFWLKRVRPTYKMQIFLNLQLLAWCSALLSISVPLAMRIQYYFVPLQILTIPAFLKEVKDRKTRLILGFLIIFVFIVITVYGISKLGWFTAWPYHYYFDYR